MDMHCQGPNEERRSSRNWVIVATIILLISSMGCSLAPVAGLASQFVEPRALAAGPQEGAGPPPLQVATRTPWPTFTPTAEPSPTPTPTSTASATPTPTDTAVPTSTPAPTATASATATSLPAATPPPTRAVAPVPPTATPMPTLTPTPSFAYRVVEEYEDRTSNPFLTGYVAIVNHQEIPIGGVKAVGIFEPGGYRYESPLSKWFFEGYSAPGDVVKTSSVKFEPGGIINGTWFIHLEDEWGTRLSEDVPITTDPDNPTWFYVKFRQPTPPGGIAAAPSGSPRTILTRVPTPAGSYAPPPTATRAAPARWSFVGTRLVQDGRSAIVYGDMVNNTGSSQKIIYLTGLFYDNRGQVIAGLANTSDYRQLQVVPSGGRVPFELTVYTVHSIADFSLSAASQPSSESPRQDFEFLDVAPSNEAGDYCVGGRLRNPGGQLLDYLVIVAVLYNDDDNVINFASYEAPSPEEVVGDQTSGFQVCVETLDQNVARYEVRAWGK